MAVEKGPHQWEVSRIDRAADCTDTARFVCRVCGSSQTIRGYGYGDVPGGTCYGPVEVGSESAPPEDVDEACLMLERFCDQRGYNWKQRKDFFDEMWGYAERAMDLSWSEKYWRDKGVEV